MHESIDSQVMQGYRWNANETANIALIQPNHNDKWSKQFSTSPNGHIRMISQLRFLLNLQWLSQITQKAISLWICDSNGELVFERYFAMVFFFSKGKKVPRPSTSIRHAVFRPLPSFFLCARPTSILLIFQGVFTVIFPCFCFLLCF